MDFGCGKSYLTFVVYYYITEILHKKAHITGLDLKREVMENCTAFAKKYGYTGLEFLCMDVKDYKPEKQVDMVITLHACDVATDYALAQGTLFGACDRRIARQAFGKKRLCSGCSGICGF